MTIFKTTTFVFTVLMVHIGTTIIAGSAHPPDPEMLQYLEKLYQKAKDLNRPLVRGELNLMPSGREGFANTIRCFFDANPSSASENSRILKFNLSSLSPSDEITSISLILKQRSNSTASSYRIQLHEIIGGELRKQINLLDSGEYYGQWHTLQVQRVQDSKDNGSGNRNYHLALSMTTEDGQSIGMGDILRNIKPMLLVYTNDLDWLGRKAGRRRDKNEGGLSFREGSRMAEKERSKRSITETAGSSSTGGTELTLDEKKQMPCRKHEAPSSFDITLAWLGDFDVLLAPAKLNFSFCHGTCNQPNNAALADLYNNHAKLMAMAAPELALEGVAPCCVTNETSTIAVYLQSILDEVVSVTSYPTVESCRCL